jgi:hypothetical protein
LLTAGTQHYRISLPTSSPTFQPGSALHDKVRLLKRTQALMVHACTRPPCISRYTCRLPY